MGRQQHGHEHPDAKRRSHDRRPAALGSRLAQRCDEHEGGADERERRRRQGERLEAAGHVHEGEEARERDRLHHRARHEERREGARARPPHCAPAA